MHQLGLDIGSSSVKAAIVSRDGERTVVFHPQIEMDIISRFNGWAEQQPEVWWHNVGVAIQKVISKANIDPKDISSIGISYQMHGLVLTDANRNVLRPAIIWCDSRAVEIGNEAFDGIGKDFCLENYLNSPGNFTASKLKWVKDNEPEIYSKIHKVLLPGDYIALKLTGEFSTTIAGLSEGILWNFKEHNVAKKLLEYYDIDSSLIPNYTYSTDCHGTLRESVAAKFGLKAGIPVSYKGGDQISNALSLNVLEPNEVAATGGTSGVIFGVSDNLICDPCSRINSFAHANHTCDEIRIGNLLCINGAGIQYSWLRKQIARDGVHYDDMERMLSSIVPGSEGLRVIPFGNGAERMLENKNIGARINNLQFTRHTRAHIYRATLEGIAFSFVFGFQVLKELGLDPSIIKVGNDNLFQSDVFSDTIAGMLGIPIHVQDTTGAIGAAIASGVYTGAFSTLEEAFEGVKTIKVYEPKYTNGILTQAYGLWKNDLQLLVNT